MSVMSHLVATCSVDPPQLESIIPEYVLLAFECSFCVCAAFEASRPMSSHCAGRSLHTPCALASPPHALPPHSSHLRVECSNTFQGCFVGEILRWNTWDSWIKAAVVTSFSSPPATATAFACWGISQRHSSASQRPLPGCCWFLKSSWKSHCTSSLD